MTRRDTLQPYDFARVPKNVDLVLEDPDDFEEDCTADPLPGPGEVIGASETAGFVSAPTASGSFAAGVT